ncbi:MAG: exodeoxyribonuclease VII large subunit [Solirubrobacterales bacterium]|nr:exodeoxyribonuclease VII large subunit [Solirubrobacterales bacterium]
MESDPRHQPLESAEADRPAPTPVGEYALQLKRDLQAMPRVTITGELTRVTNNPRHKQVYFELTDDRGGVPGTIWRNVFESCDLPENAFKAGAEVVVTGRPDYYEGRRTASPSFSFRATGIRLSGEGDLLARLEVLRKQFAADGLLDRQKLLPRPALPRRIGVITAETGAAKDDLLAGLERRGWAGEIVWGFAPVQDRKAAPTITRILSDMAAFGEVEAIVVCRGGGSLTDLWAFCDETLCRTVALLAVPVVSAVGHERDVTLLDDVAAVRCSTPTHAADGVIRIDCRAEREALIRRAGRVSLAGPVAVRSRAIPLEALAAGPGRALRQERNLLNQKTREIAAASRRGLVRRGDRLAAEHVMRLAAAAERFSRTIITSQGKNAQRPERIRAGAARLFETRARTLQSERVAIDAHDPQRTLERGYARILDRSGEPVVDPASARRAGDVKIRFAKGDVEATVGAPGKRKRHRSSRAPTDRENEFKQITLEGVESDE